MGPLVLPYGAWPSPITAGALARTSIGLGQIALDGDDAYWVESRPADAGRCVPVRAHRDEPAIDALPAPWSSRSGVHEYGGGAFAVHAGTLYFTNAADQMVYVREPGCEPRSLTPQAAARHADLVVDPTRRRLICVREDYADPPDGREPENLLVAVDLRGGRAPRPLARGADFYASPCLSPDGNWLAWLEWNHPAMPWDGTVLRRARFLPDGSLGPSETVAGGPAESVFQPSFSPRGELFFVSDRSGWWNLHCATRDGTRSVLATDAEFGLPQWVFGQSTYGFLSADRLLCAANRAGQWSLHLVQLETGRHEEIATPYDEIQQVRCNGRRAVFCGGSATEAPTIVELDVGTRACRALRRSGELPVDREWLSVPEPIEISTTDGARAHALHYAPRNPRAHPPAGERPPLLVLTHGGPTAAASRTLSLVTQFWTSRGFAVVDVDYGGSTGYGRAYRSRLDRAWGIVDVDDCIAAARYLVARGDADGARLAIRGSSAGGYTTLCALTFRDEFRAGASAYGISDLEALQESTHKFEAHYLERLVGPWPTARETYRQRSPIHSVDRLACPVIFFQGLLDRAVPPDQAERMVNALRRKRLPVAALVFPDEGHGFRRAETLCRVREAELTFFARILGFTPADSLPALRIENL